MLSGVRPYDTLKTTCISTAVDEALGFQAGSGQFGVHAGDEADGTQVKHDPVSGMMENF
jgi:hypothetical protein